MGEIQPREDFLLVHGPLDGEVISLSYGATTTVTFEHKGRVGRYVMLAADLTAKDGVTPATPTACKLYWQPSV